MILKPELKMTSVEPSSLSALLIFCLMNGGRYSKKQKLHSIWHRGRAGYYSLVIMIFEIHINTNYHNSNDTKFPNLA